MMQGFQCTRCIRSIRIASAIASPRLFNHGTAIVSTLRMIRNARNLLALHLALPSVSLLSPSPFSPPCSPSLAPSLSVSLALCLCVQLSFWSLSLSLSLSPSLSHCHVSLSGDVSITCVQLLLKTKRAQGKLGQSPIYNIEAPLNLAVILNLFDVHTTTTTIYH